MKSFFKFLFLPFYYIFKLLFYILLYGTIFLLFLVVGFIILRLLYEGLMFYAGPGLDYVLAAADVYRDIAEQGMEIAIKEGSNLDWCMYAALKCFVLFCVLFYSIPFFIITIIFIASADNNSYTTYQQINTRCNVSNSIY